MPLMNVSVLVRQVRVYSILPLAMGRGVAGRSPLEVGSSSLDQASLAALSLEDSGPVSVRT